MKTFKIHLCYLFPRSAKLLFILLLLILIVCYIMILYNVDKFQSYKNIVQNYFINCVIPTKMMILFITVFFYSTSINEHNDFGIYFIMGTNISRMTSLMIKKGLCYLTVFACVIIAGISFFLIGCKWFISYNEIYAYILFFLNVFILSSIYGEYSIIIMQLSNNRLLSLILIFIFFMVDDLFVDTQTSFYSKIILFVFPNINMDTTTSLYGDLHLIWLLIILNICNFYIYLKRDLR